MSNIHRIHSDYDFEPPPFWRGLGLVERDKEADLQVAATLQEEVSYSDTTYGSVVVLARSLQDPSAEVVFFELSTTQESPKVKDTRRSVSPGHRSQELEWRRSHADVLRAFAGQWVVLEGEDIVASGNDPARVVAEARARGIQVPYLFRVEYEDEEIVKMGL